MTDFFSAMTPVTTAYLIMELLTLVALYLFVMRGEYQVGLNFFVMAVFVIRGFGQFMMSISTSEQMLFFADYITYFGSVFLPPLMYISAARLCREEPPKWLVTILSVFSALVFIFCLNIGRNDLYYVNARYAKENGFAYIAKDGYGPLHSVYTAMVIMYGVLFALLLGRSIILKKISRKMLIGIMVCAAAILGLYSINRLTQIKLNLTSIAYFIISLWALKFFDEYNIHSLYATVSETLGEAEGVGYVVFDKHMGFVNSNAIAKKLFPEINELNIDQKVKKSDTIFYSKIILAAADFLKGDPETVASERIRIGENTYFFRFSKVLVQAGTVIGVLVEIHDVTAKAQFEEIQTRYSKDLETDVEKKQSEIIKMQNDLVVGLATMIESRDNSTGEHITRTIRVAECLSKFLENTSKEITPEKLKKYLNAVSLHDIGKITIEDKILRAAYPYTEEQKAELDKHPVEGAKIIRKIFSLLSDDDFVDMAADIARYHHENWDGSGLPDGLAGNEIPVFARITRIIDVFDNCAVDFSTGAIHTDAAFEEIRNGIGTKFDPDFSELFLSHRNEIEEIYKNVRG